jgi:hypothetical protein
MGVDWENEGGERGEAFDRFVSALRCEADSLARWVSDLEECEHSDYEDGWPAALLEENEQNFVRLALEELRDAWQNLPNVKGGAS